jgi:tol-pal system protein YbgF
MVGHATRGWSNRGSWVVAGSLALGLALGLAGAARADEVDDLRAELDQLKQQVLYLQNQVPGASAGGAGGGNLAAQQEVRMEQFQQQLTDLTGQIERVELKVNELSDQVTRMQKDTEYRLGVLEGNNGGAAGGAMMGAAPTGDSSQNGGQHVTSEPPPPNTHVTTDTVQQPQQQNQAQNGANAAVPPPSGQPGVLGTLSASQAANLPQAPAGAADAAAARAGQQGQQTAMQNTGGGLPNGTPREQYEYATNLIQRGNYDQAEVALRAFVQQHPKDELTGNAQYWLGETYYVRNNFKSAAVAFAEGYQKYPNSQKAPDNLLKLAMALGQQGQKENACVALRQLEKRYPDASANIKDRAVRAKKNYSCA